MSESTKVSRYCPICYRAGGPDENYCPDHGCAFVEPATTLTIPTGTTLGGKYLVEGLLGKGGMGSVYRALQLPMRRAVALKVLHPELLADPGGVRRFIDEASAVSRLRSRFSATIYDFGLAPEGYLYFSMELAEGSLLADVLARDGRVGLERALHIGIDICRSLEEAHSRGIIHRDLKPGNIILTVDGDHEIAKVVDFGTSLFLERTRLERLTMEGKVLGTPHYVSPEQAMARETSVGSDLYSLGVILFEMITGELPFDGPSLTSVLIDKISRPAPDIREAAPDLSIPVSFASLIMSLLERAPEQRPVSAARVRIMLEDELASLESRPVTGHDILFRKDSTPVPGFGSRPTRVLDPYKDLGLSIDPRVAAPALFDSILEDNQEVMFLSEMDPPWVRSDSGERPSFPLPEPLHKPEQERSMSFLTGLAILVGLVILVLGGAALFVLLSPAEAHTPANVQVAPIDRSGVDNMSILVPETPGNRADAQAR